MVSKPTKNSDIFYWKIPGMLHIPMGGCWYLYLPHWVTIVHSSLDLELISICQYPIFRSSVVPQRNPSSLKKRSCILGMGYIFRKIRFLSSLKGQIRCTVIYFFGMRNFGAPHWYRLDFLITLRASILLSSCFNVSSCMHGTGNVFP